MPNYNPYKTDLFTNGLDYIIANLPGSPTVNQLNETVIAYFASLPDPDPDHQIIMQQTNLFSINNYINQQIAANLNYDAPAWAFIESVISGTKQNTIDSLTEYLLYAQEQLAVADINTPSKNALYIALTNAQGSCAYWQTIVESPGSWATYLHANEAVNYANIPTWIVAAFTGALSGFAQMQEPAVNGATITNAQGRMVGQPMAYGSALAVNAGKVIFKWAKRPVGNCGCAQ